MAAAAHNAEPIMAKLAVAFAGAIRLIPKKIITSQKTITSNIGLEMDFVDSACMSDRIWAISTIRLTSG